MGAYANPIQRQSGFPGVQNSGPGSNQYFNNVPSMFNPYSGGPNTGLPGGGGSYFSGGPTAMDSGASSYNPYQVPGTPGNGAPGYGLTDYGSSGPQWLGTPGHSSNLGHGIIATGLQYPGLSSDFANYLMSQVGQGMSPFGLSTPLPTGGMTRPGQLTAGMNPLLSQLANFFQTGQGGNMPGMNTLSTIANQGISALPEWQAMIAAMQPNIQQNQAMMQEQFAGMGDLAGSPFGTAESNYMSQTALGQNALLAQLQQSNLQNIQMPAIQEMLSGTTNMASGLQSLDQQAIQNMYQEFQRVSPQNNPMLQYLQGMSTLYPPTTKTPTTWENVNSTIGALTGSGFNTSGGTQIGF